MNIYVFDRLYTFLCHHESRQQTEERDENQQILTTAFVYISVQFSGYFILPHNLFLSLVTVSRFLRECFTKRNEN